MSLNPNKAFINLMYPLNDTYGFKLIMCELAFYLWRQRLVNCFLGWVETSTADTSDTGLMELNGTLGIKVWKKNLKESENLNWR